MAGEGPNSPAEDEGTGGSAGADSRNSSGAKTLSCPRRTEPVVGCWQQQCGSLKHPWLYIGLRANLKYKQQ